MPCAMCKLDAITTLRVLQLRRCAACLGGACTTAVKRLQPEGATFTAAIFHMVHLPA